MLKLNLIRKLSPIILCLGLSFIQSRNLETKQSLTKNIQQITGFDGYKINYNRVWTGDIRTVNVSVGADEEFIEKYSNSWKDRIDEFIKNVSENYYRNFGIEFKIVEYIEWKSDDFSYYSDLLNDIKSIGVSGDIFIAYTKQTDRFDYLSLGIAEHKYAIVRDTWTKCSIFSTTHEIGHSFDLKHVTESWSYMNSSTFFCHPILADWDESSKEKLLKNKYKYFE